MGTGTGHANDPDDSNHEDTARELEQGAGFGARPKRQATPADLERLADLLRVERVDAFNAARAEFDPSSLKFRRIDLEGRNLRGVDLSGCDLSHAKLFGTRLVQSNLKGASLRGVLAHTQTLPTVLIGATLDGADLSDAFLAGADCSNVSCRGALFLGAHLERVRFDRADLTRADFGGASMVDILVSDAVLDLQSLDEHQRAGLIS